MDRLRSRPQPPLTFLRLRHDTAMPFFAVLCFVGALFLLSTVGRLAVELVRGTRDPHRHLFGKRGVRPLFDEDLVFDIGISVFAQKPIDEERWPECSAAGEADWYRDLYEVEPQSEEEIQLRQFPAYSGLPTGEGGPTSWQIKHVPETEEIWSGVVANNLTLRNSTVKATVDLDIPVEFLKPLGAELPAGEGGEILDWRSYWVSKTGTRRPNVYAVVTLVPHLTDLRWTWWYKDGMDDLPLLGSRVLQEGQSAIGVASDEDREKYIGNQIHAESIAHARRVLMESLSIRVPLLEARTKPHYLTKAVKAVLLKRTSHMDHTGFTERGHELFWHGCGSDGLEYRHRLMCKEHSYAEMGHWYAGFAFGRPVLQDGSEAEYDWEDSKKRRYAPYFTAPRVGPLDYTAVTFEHEPSLHHSVAFQLSVIDELRLGVLLGMSQPPLPGNGSRYIQNAHDHTTLWHAVLGIGPRLGAGIGIVLSTLAKGARYAATTLTVLYWATRRTTTGISLSGLSFAVTGGILRLIVGTWDYYKFTLEPVVFWLAIWPILLLPALLQIRLLLPFVIEKEKEEGPGRPTALRIVRVPLTARERRSSRLSPTWQQLAGLTVILACAAYATFFHPVRLLGSSHGEDWHEDYDAMFPAMRAWNKWNYRGYWLEHSHWFRRHFQKIKLLPLAQALITAGQLGQLAMNNRSGTFAGNYALSCYLRAFSLVGLISPFLTGSAYFEGLYLSAVAQAGLVLAEAWQAWRYPRVEQEVEGEEMEL